MKFISPSTAFGIVSLLSQLHSVHATLLVDFNAKRGDDPAVLGRINIENSKDEMLPGNTAACYIKLDKDPNGVPAAHVHRDPQYIRAEYHTLQNKIEAEKTYYIGYTFSISTLVETLTVWQWKEYKEVKSQNVPLNLEYIKGVMEMTYEAPGLPKTQKWKTTIKAGVIYHAGIVINTSKTNGYTQLYWEGVRQTFDDNGKSTQNLQGLFFPGQSDPKFGAYRGSSAVDIDTYIYQVQIGTTLDDVKQAAGLGSGTPVPPPSTTLTTIQVRPTETPTCSWAGHCAGAKCKDENDCSDNLVCTGGRCAIA